MIGLLLGFGLLPLAASAAPDAGPPTTVPAACTGLPAGAPLIPGLVTGQATTSGESVTLLLSSTSFACGAYVNSVSAEGCHDQWTFSLTVPASAMQPGVYNLAAISAQFGELYGIAGPLPPNQQGCNRVPCSYGSFGVGSDDVGDSEGPVADPGASLEIYAANGACVTGAVTGMSDSMPHAPDHNGAFFALSCPQ